MKGHRQQMTQARFNYKYRGDGIKKPRCWYFTTSFRQEEGKLWKSPLNMCLRSCPTSSLHGSPVKMKNKIHDGSMTLQQLSFYPDTQTEAVPAPRLRPISNILVLLSCGDPNWDPEAPVVWELPEQRGLEFTRV